MEKEAYTVDAPLHDDPARIVEDKGMRMGEAADVYGDIQTAEDYGYVSRGYVSRSSLVLRRSFANLVERLKSRHIQFIALGGTIGTGLFLGIGRAFTQAGPLSVLLGYTLTGIAVFAMVRSPHHTAAVWW